MWLLRTVGAINFSASPHIYPRKMDRFLFRESAPRDEGDAGDLHFTLPHVGLMSGSSGGEGGSKLQMHASSLKKKKGRGA